MTGEIMFSNQKNQTCVELVPLAQNIAIFFNKLKDPKIRLSRNRAIAIVAKWNTQLKGISLSGSNVSTMKIRALKANLLGLQSSLEERELNKRGLFLEIEHIASSIDELCGEYQRGTDIDKQIAYAHYVESNPARLEIRLACIDNERRGITSTSASTEMIFNLKIPKVITPEWKAKTVQYLQAYKLKASKEPEALKRAIAAEIAAILNKIEKQEEEQNVDGVRKDAVSKVVRQMEADCKLNIPYDLENGGRIESRTTKRNYVYNGFSLCTRMAIVLDNPKLTTKEVFDKVNHPELKLPAILPHFEIEEHRYSHSGSKDYIPSISCLLDQMCLCIDAVVADRHYNALYAKQEVEDQFGGVEVIQQSKHLTNVILSFAKDILETDISLFTKPGRYKIVSTAIQPNTLRSTMNASYFVWVMRDQVLHHWLEMAGVPSVEKWNIWNFAKK